MGGPYLRLGQNIYLLCKIQHRVAHPILQLPQSEFCELNPFIQLLKQLKIQSTRSRMESWQPISPMIEADEPEADIPLAIPPLVTLHEALAHIERLLLFSLQAEPTANIDELQEILKREQQRIEILVPPPRYSFVHLCSYYIYLLIPQPVLLLASLIPYFPIFSVYKNILVISIPHPVPTICLYREYSVSPLLIPACVVHTPRLPTLLSCFVSASRSPLC